MKLTLEFGDLRTRIEVAERASDLMQKLNKNTSPSSQQLQSAMEGRKSLTEIDVLASFLERSDPNLAVAAAKWIDHQAQTFERTAHSGCSTWWLNSETPGRLLTALSNENAQIRWHLLRAHRVLRFGEPRRVLPVLLDRLEDFEHEAFPLAALRAIQALGVDLAFEAVERIAPLADDSSPEVRSAIYRFLEWLGPDAISALPMLVSRIVAERINKGLLKEATAALVAVQPDQSALVELITPENRQVLIESLQDFGESGRALRRAIGFRTTERIPEQQAETSSEADDLQWLKQTQIAKIIGKSARTVRRDLDAGRLKPLEIRKRGKKKCYEEYRFNLRTLRNLRLGE